MELNQKLEKISELFELENKSVTEFKGEFENNMDGTAKYKIVLEFEEDFENCFIIDKNPLKIPSDINNVLKNVNEELYEQFLEGFKNNVSALFEGSQIGRKKGTSSTLKTISKRMNTPLVVNSLTEARVLANEGYNAMSQHNNFDGLGSKFLLVDRIDEDFAMILFRLGYKLIGTYRSKV